MLQYMFNQITFYIALGLVLFVPGYALLLAIFGQRKILSNLERFIISFGLSLISVDFIYFSFSGLHISITRLSTFLGILFFSFICFAIYKFRTSSNVEKENSLFDFSKNQFVLILLLLFLTIFIKTAYLSDTVFPTATDMGHHMYWAKWMVENHQLPTYESMPDFIIGEHLIFGAIALLSGTYFFSAFPVIILLLINLLGILTVFIFTLRIFKNKTIATLTLLFLGVLYAIASPQAKFVSGGVIGNIMGNFLMPLAFYFYYRAFEFLESASMPDKNSKTFLALAIFTTFGLFYTHHLTAFIFLFIFALLVIIFLAVNFKNFKEILTKIFHIAFSPQVLSVFVIGLIFFFFIFTPNYFKTSAVDTAVGAPSKDTRVGLTIANLRSSIGEARLALGFIGLLILSSRFKKRSFGYTIIFAWTAMIFIMSTLPNVLFINLPSNRIGNYLSYPVAILSAYALYFVFRSKSKTQEESFIVSSNLLKIGFTIILAFVLVDGISDSTLAFKNQSDLRPLAQTFNASEYLGKNLTDSDMVLKDHNYITADSWIKLFFMRGYKYPLSRGYFKRYEDTTKPREMCTLTMISAPNSNDARACFAQTSTNFIIVNPQFDSAQFKKSKDFNQIYSNPEINIYYRTN